ncbi:MAG: response regulator, partial [Cyclobacteriaceae bacterium]|nr:response regulator [Cyclobacteriaceae bacterium]
IRLNVTLDDSSQNYLIIEVSDNGCGLDEKIKKKIFDPFFTTKEFGKGTGLGLSTVYGIVKQNNGYIWVDSQKGEGAIFTIYWPLASIQEYKTYEDRPRKLIKGTETILMVEDEPQVLDIGTRILKKSGYNIIKAPNAEKGIEIINSYKGKIDMLFTDVILPGKDGIDCAKEFTKKRPEGVVLFSSGYTNDRLEEKGFNEKKVNMIFKPYNVERLTSKVAELFKVQ